MRAIVLKNPNAVETVSVHAWETRRLEVYFGLADERPATHGSANGKSWSYAFLRRFSDNGSDEEWRNLHILELFTLNK